MAGGTNRDAASLLSWVNALRCVSPRGAALGSRVTPMRLWASGDVTLAGSALSDLLITTAGSTVPLPRGSFPRGYRLPVVLLASRVPSCPSTVQLPVGQALKLFCESTVPQQSPSSSIAYPLVSKKAAAPGPKRLTDYLAPHWSRISPRAAHGRVSDLATEP